MSTHLVGFPRRDDGAPGSILIAGEAYRGRDLRDTRLPSFAVTSKARSWQHFVADDLAMSATAGGQLTAGEAGALQGFPIDYPWQGSRTAQIAQAANAVPPPLAAALINYLTS